MEIEIEGLEPGKGLVRKWYFRIALLVGAITCFLGPIVTSIDRYELSHGVPATIERASKYTTAPTKWSGYEGRLRASFDVKVHAADGREFITPLFLPKEIVESLMQGEKAEIVFVKDRPGRHLLKGEPLPQVSWSLILGGFIFLGVFILSLKLR